MNNNIYLENDRIYLRAVEPTDLEIMYSIENNPSMWQVSSFTVPYSRYILKQYIENSSYDIYADKQLRLMIVQKDNHTIIGIIDITDFAPLHGRGAVGIVINDTCRNQGFGKEALMLLLDYSFNYLHLKQLYAYIGVENDQSINLFSSCGFNQSGLLKEWIYANHRYQDALIMQCIFSD